MRYLLAGSFLVLAFAACSAQKQPDGYLMQAKAAPGGMYVDAVSSEKERADLESWAKSVDDILTSKAFFENLETVAADHATIYVGSNMQKATPADLVALLKNEKKTHRYVPTPVSLVGFRTADWVTAGQSG